MPILGEVLSEVATIQYLCQQQLSSFFIHRNYYLASVIARKVEFKAMAPTHCSFSVSGNSLE